jgi:hypothetical protein
MNLCSENHDEVCFEGHNCPVCLQAADLNSYIVLSGTWSSLNGFLALCARDLKPRRNYNLSKPQQTMNERTKP